MSGTGPEAEPPLYAVRVVPEVSAWIEAEHARQGEEKGMAEADAWERGLLSALSSLATYPRRCAVAAEDVLFAHGPLRLLLYPLRRGGPVWRILFTVHEAREDSAAVYIRLIRHSAQAPLVEWPGESG